MKGIRLVLQCREEVIARIVVGAILMSVYLLLAVMA